MIDKFRGEYSFLSNMYECPVTFEDHTYRCSEAAFQAQKTDDEEIHQHMTKMDGTQAKRFSRQLHDPNWYDKSVGIMLSVLISKFTQNKDLSEKLLATGDEELVEGNTWNDTFWGVCNGVGKNTLGQLLMYVRHLIKTGEVEEWINVK